MTIPNNGSASQFQAAIGQKRDWVLPMPSGNIPIISKERETYIEGYVSANYSMVTSNPESTRFAALF